MDGKELIINEIQHYPELYLIRHPDYNKLFNKEVAWRKLAQSIGWDVKSLKAKWKNMRDTYKKYKQSKLINCGSNAKKYANWLWAEKMSFLDGNFRPAKNTFRSDDEGIEEKINSIKQEACEVQCIDDSDPLSNTEAERPAKRKRRLDTSDRNNRNSTDNLETRIADYTPSTSQNLVNVSCDRLDMTFLGFADSVKKLSAKNQAVIKLEILKLITEYELKDTVVNRPDSKRYIIIDS